MGKRTVVLLVGSVLAAAVGAQAPSGSPIAPFAGSRGSVSVEALTMWVKSSPTPVPIITDNYYGQDGTHVLLGGWSVDTNPNPGFRITGTYALDSRWGIEATGFYVRSRTTSRGVSSSGQLGSTDLLLPFFDVTESAESYTEISYSPEWAGSAKETLTNHLGGGELNGRWALSPQGPWRIDLLGGFRYLQLRENYTITTTSPYIPPNPADIWITTDQFDAANRFYGAQVGVRASYDQGRWVGSGFAKVALGTMRQSLAVNGYLEANDFNNYGATQFFPGGYFALPTNMGDHSRNTFAVVPEVGVSLGYRVTPTATVFVGYAFLYASSVARPGEQINRNINPTQSVSYGGEPPARLAGPAQPTFSFNATDFWAQSVSLGVAVRF